MFEDLDHMCIVADFPATEYFVSTKHFAPLLRRTRSRKTNLHTHSRQLLRRYAHLCESNGLHAETYDRRIDSEPLDLRFSVDPTHGAVSLHFGTI